MPRLKSDKQLLDLLEPIDLKRFRESFLIHFIDFSDPRNAKKCIYPSWYLILIIVCGYFSNCNTIQEITDFAELRHGWLIELTGCEFDVPSYNTIWWFLTRTKPHAFKQLLGKWLSALSKDLRDKLLVIDGKRLRGVSTDEHITHLVELFSSESGLVIAQERVPDKTNERQAVSTLLDAVDVSGAMISTDALYTHIADMEKIIKAGADFLTGIKGNQSILEAEVSNFFEQAYAVDYEDVEVTRYETLDKDHGRIEHRKICVTNNLEWLPQRESWHFQSLIEVRSSRTIKGKTEESIRYYGSSRKSDAKYFAKCIRDHWSIENNLHYVMDVVFEEDDALNNVGYSAENTALIRRLVSNIINTFDPGRGMAKARRCATYKPDYLRGILGKMFC